MQLCSNMAKAVICVLLASLFACCRSAPVAFHGGSDVICPLTVKILDAVKGTPAGNIALDVYRQDQGGTWEKIASGKVDMMGEVHNLITEEEFTPGVYRVEFDTKAYWKAEGRTPFHQVADMETLHTNAVSTSMTSSFAAQSQLQANNQCSHFLYKSRRKKKGSISVGQDQFTCPVCLDLLKNPVTIPCGHSYCMICITCCWNQEDQRGGYSCPQCRQTFSPRPALCKNVVFDEMVEKLKKTKLQTAVPAGASCQSHFDRHEEFWSSKPHKVINATGRLQQMICPQHHKQLEIYCRTDQHYICYLCAVDEHKHHNTVTAIAERTEKQKHLEQTQRDFQQRIQLREKDLQELREVVKTHKRSAKEAVQDTERNFTELMRLIERNRSEVTQLIRDQEKAAVSRAEEHMKQLEQEIDDLRRRDTELEKLLQTDDHIHFLLSVESCSVPPQTMYVPRITPDSHLLYEDVGKSVLLLKKRVEGFCKEVIGKISCTVPYIEIISTSEERIQSPQKQSWGTIPGSPSGRPQKAWSQSRSLSDSKYWHFTE